MDAAPRGTRAITAAAVVCAALFLFLAVAPPVHAQPSGLTTSPAKPVAGDTVSAEGPFRECVSNAAPTYTFTFALHNSDGSTTVTSSGAGTSGSNGEDYSATVPQAGTYTATEDAYCPTNNDHVTWSVDFNVGAALGGSISVSPDPAVVNQTATLSATPTGGNPGYTYAWTVDGVAVPGVSGSPFEADYTFTTTGSHTASVQITDNDQGNFPQTHTTMVTRTINVVKAGSTPPPPPPPPCVSRVAFQLSEFTTGGCFTKTSSSPDRWVTRSTVKLNGITLPGFGQTFTITAPTASEPGGHFTAPNSTIQLDRFTAFSGDIDWSLPAGGLGQEKALKSFSVTPGATLFGLQVSGSIALELGDNKQDGYFADFPLNIQLPASFTAGPDPSFGSVTGAASLIVTDAGVRYNGLQLQAQNVWLGKLKVNNVCFSYIPAGGTSTAPCDAPTFGGTDIVAQPPGSNQPFIQCNSDATTNRWDASADIELPSGLELGAFGGLANGTISKLGASVGNLGTRVPITNGVYLDHVDFGLCLSPPPFKIRANMGANFLGNKNLVNVDGGFTYTDATVTSPWSFELDGEVSVADTQIGAGTLGINGAGGIDFGLEAGVNLSGVASLNAQVSGWIDAPRRQFVVSGSGQGCLGSACATAEGELSSTGVAGCVTVGTSTPTYDLIIPLDGSPPYLDTRTYDITAGFGHVWGTSTVDLLGDSCDFSPYEPTRAAGAQAAAGARRLRITRGTQAVSLRIHGTNGPPKVVLHGPRHATITSPSDGTTTLSKGHYLLVENKTNGTTDVMLVHPAAGTWTVSQAPGSDSSPTTVDRATLQAPPTIGARVLAKRGRHTVQVAYATPPGTSLRLVERAKGINHTIAAHVRGRRCPGLPRMRPHTDEKILCAKVRFRPSQGPGGKREIQAVVTRGPIPLLQKNIASFRVPRLKRPSRVTALRARRSRGSLVVAFRRSRGASRYSVSAKLSDGRQLAFDLGGGCRALRIANVPVGDAAAVKIAGVRYDLVMGRARSVSIKANARSTGHSRKKKWRTGKVCT
jgi:hypothetical protein